MKEQSSLITAVLHNSRKQSPPSEANSHSASPEIPHLLRNPKAQYSVHNSSLQVRGPV